MSKAGDGKIGLWGVVAIGVGGMAGRVLVIPTEQMPGQTGLAATYRH